MGLGITGSGLVAAWDNLVMLSYRPASERRLFVYLKNEVKKTVLERLTRTSLLIISRAEVSRVAVAFRAVKLFLTPFLGPSQPVDPIKAAKLCASCETPCKGF